MRSAVHAAHARNGESASESPPLRVRWYFRATKRGCLACLAMPGIFVYGPTADTLSGMDCITDIQCSGGIARASHVFEPPAAHIYGENVNSADGDISFWAGSGRVPPIKFSLCC